MAAHKPSALRFWRCWSAVAGWPEKTGNSSLAQSHRCRLIAVMAAAVRLLGPMDCTRSSKRCLLTPKPTDLCHSAGPAFLSHDRVSSAPCLRAAAQSHAATSTGVHTHLRALGRHWLHSQRGGASCVFVCAQDRPTPHTAAPDSPPATCTRRRLLRALRLRSASFWGCEVPFVVCVGDSNHRGVSRFSCCLLPQESTPVVVRSSKPQKHPHSAEKPLHIQK